ncbi:uncharacterized protein AB675_7227 [Cyphellophora attinorum]|uniref:Xylanolytic transcriptional activator regulatory domain-containing protein n=1 Tax=Cyphellophora attinorum TaxID=1664694 RepID=A0A0N1NXK1_9EURO|nr:uncharacterized protein AB675_7227 [Phialophora attinorum]KPI35065.1 hypothetical protein AB675_7227 [Phialophora attinorum]
MVILQSARRPAGTEGLECKLSQPAPSVAREQNRTGSSAQQRHAATFNDADTAVVDISQPETEDIADRLSPTQQDPTSMSALSFRLPQPIAQQALPELSMDQLELFDDTGMGTFLFDIMNPISGEATSNFIHSGPIPDVLDFAFDDFLTFPSAPVQMTQTTFPTQLSTLRPMSSSGAVTPTARAVGLGQQAFKDSAWSWTPKQGDHRHAEQLNLAVRDETLIEAGISPSASLATPRFSQASRDRLLSMISRSCEASIQRHVISSFPSAASLSSILDTFSDATPYEIARWVQMPTLQVDEEREEFIGALLATAATSSDQHSFVDSALRFKKPLGLVIQSSALLIHIGLWSGNRRKMEIAESFTYPLITMLRRSGHFRRDVRNEVLPDLSTLSQEVWLQWLHAESFRRLAYHMFLQDTAVSMAFVTPPLMSCTELHLPLPCSDGLWQSASLQGFERELAAGAHPADQSRLTLRDCLNNLELLSHHAASVDRQMSLDIVVSCFWSRVWQFRQMTSTPDSSDDLRPGHAASALHQELTQTYRHLQMQPVDFDDAASCWKIKLELCMIHLHVSLEDIQLFAGKEGEIEARRMVPILRRWFTSSASRQALRHAGQVLRAASQHRKGPLPGLSAVAVYHASLAMWAFGIWSAREVAGDGRGAVYGQQEQCLMIDADDSEPQWESFLLLRKGRPCIQNYTRLFAQHDNGVTAVPVPVPPVPLEEPLEVMKSIISLLAAKCGETHTTPPMAESLAKLMLSLGKAATVTRRSYI